MSYPILYSKNEYKRFPAIAGRAVAGQSIVGSTSSLENPFQTRGLGTLSDCISCTVTEERNGSYELEMQYSISGIHFEDLQQRYFILAKPNYLDDPQPFRIYKITKPINKICTIYARHISYDLSGFEVPAGISMPSAPLALAKLDEYANGFNIGGQVGGTAEFKTDVPSSVRSWFGGREGSLIDLYGGEWHYDGTDCQLMANRGADRGVTIFYGKNLTSLTQDEECSNVYSHVRAYWKSGDSQVYVSNLVTTGIVLQPTRIYFLDCSSDFQDPPSVADLNAKAVAYIRANNMNTPRVNLSLDYVQMAAFDRVDLCDIVTVGFGELGVYAKAKCIKTKWNVLTDRYDEITLGDAKTSFADTVTDISTKVTDVAVKRTTNILTEAIDHATEMITGNLGGYVVLHDSDGDELPDEILIMDQPNIEDAVNIWRWNQSGLGHSSTGYNGTFGLAMTADGRIVADYITAGTMSANHIRGGTLQLGGINNEYGVLQVLDASGNVIGSWTKDGADITGALTIVTAGYKSYGTIYTRLGNFDLYNSETDVTWSDVCGLAIESYNNPLNDKMYLVPAYTTSNSAYDTGIVSTIYATSGIRLSPNSSHDGTERVYLTLDSQHLGNIEMAALSGQPLKGFNISLNRTRIYAAYSTGTGNHVAFEFKGGTTTAFSCSGSKSRLMHTEDYADRLLYCYETPTPMFGDLGEGTIGEDGKCYVWIESIFAETIDTAQYQVFLQKYGDGDCWVVERKGNYFIVEGTVGLSFGWELKAKQIDYTQKRLDSVMDTEIPNQVDLGQDALNYIKDLKEGRVA